MGIDGTQHLDIYGPAETMNALEACCLVLETTKEDLAYIGKRFFGKEFRIKRHAFNHISLSYEFRNEPIYEYLTELLVQHPKCWIKNEYHTEDGDCAIWIARMVDGKPSVHEIEWQELYIEEAMDGQDFSKTTEASVPQVLAEEDVICSPVSDEVTKKVVRRKN